MPTTRRHNVRESASWSIWCEAFRFTTPELINAPLTSEAQKQFVALRVSERARCTCPTRTPHRSNNSFEQHVQIHLPTIWFPRHTVFFSSLASFASWIWWEWDVRGRLLLISLSGEFSPFSASLRPHAAVLIQLIIWEEWRLKGLSMQFVVQAATHWSSLGSALPASPEPKAMPRNRPINYLSNWIQVSAAARPLWSGHSFVCPMSDIASALLPFDSVGLFLSHAFVQHMNLVLYEKIINQVSSWSIHYFTIIFVRMPIAQR